MKINELKGRLPYSLAELRAMIPRLEAGLAEIESEFPNARPVPPLAADEVLELLHGLMGAAASRSLTRDEIFLHGQLLCSYKMAVQAETLGKKGRYFVVSEEDLHRMGRL